MALSREVKLMSSSARWQWHVHQAQFKEGCLILPGLASLVSTRQVCCHSDLRRSRGFMTARADHQCFLYPRVTVAQNMSACITATDRL